MKGNSETGGSQDPYPQSGLLQSRGAPQMANIGHEAVFSAAWILMRRTTDSGSGTRRSEISSQLAENNQGGQAYTKEAVGKLIAAYLDTPTHISSTFSSW